MQTRKLGGTDLNLSVVGLGTWAIGGGGLMGWGPQDDKESIATVHRAIEKGVNWIDTAPGYGFGHSEEVVGEAIKGLHDKPIIATKCGEVWDDNKKLSKNLKKDSIRFQVEASLRRLKIDVIDLYQIHHPTSDEDIQEAWRSVMADLIKEGKIRYAGVSNFDVRQLELVQSIRPIASVQVSYNMFRRGIENELLGYCSKNNIGVVVHTPLYKGLLTGKFNKERVKNLPQDDHRQRTRPFREPALSINLELVESLRPITERNGKTLAQLAVAWILRRPEVTSAIVGTRHPSQIEETVEASDWKLSEEDISAIDVLLEKRKNALSQIFKFRLF